VGVWPEGLTVPVDPLFHQTPVSNNKARATTVVSGAADNTATCTDCGGPLEPGRYARCLACTSALWVALEERYGREWAARHRGQPEEP